LQQGATHAERWFADILFVVGFPLSQVQNKLRYKLKLAQDDLNRLQKQMEHIAGKENEFSDTERNLKNTMNALKNSLLKLRGQENARLVKEGIDVPLP
jgi:predicted helicase